MTIVDFGSLTWFDVKVVELQLERFSALVSDMFYVI